MVYQPKRAFQHRTLHVRRPGKGRAPEHRLRTRRIDALRKVCLGFLPLFFLLLAFIPASNLPAQDWVHTGTNLGNPAIRLAAADFKPAGGDPQTPALKSVFDTTLFNDLKNAGIFEMVSKSLAPQAMPGSPQELMPAQWTAPPANAAMVALGALGVNNGRLAVYGWLMDANTAKCPSADAAVQRDGQRRHGATIAHRFADDIIARLGGGMNGIAETKIYFVSNRDRVEGDLGDGLRRRKPARRHASGHGFACRRASRPMVRASRFRPWETRVGRFACFTGFGAHGEFSGGNGGREQPVAGVVGRWHEDCIFFGARRAIRRFGLRMPAAAICTS